MAARRLIIVLVVLLAVSIVAAAIAPDRRSDLLRGGEETTEPEPPAPPETASPERGGAALTRTIVASPASPETVGAAPGDQLSLSVEVAETTEVQIEPLGVIETASPDDPALFELLLRDPGALPVTTTGDGRIVGRILVEEGGRVPPIEKGEDEARGERSGSR